MKLLIIQIQNEPTIEKIDEAPFSPAEEKSSNTRAPFQPSMPFIGKSTSVESAASSSSSSKYGHKVNDLKKKFDYPNAGLVPGNTIDTKKMDFGKAKSLFESAFQPTARYQSPYAAKREQAVTNIRRYDHPNPTKKPAHCEIVTGPTFKQSVNYWQDRERAVSSSDPVEVATQLFKGPTKRENSKGDNIFYSSNQHPPARNETTSPSPKVTKYYDPPPQTAMEQARRLVSFADDSDAESGNQKSGTSFHTATNSSWKNEKNFDYKPLVVTESFTAFSTMASSKKSESAASFSVPSDSFDYQKSSTKDISQPPTDAPLSPLGPSLLDDINQDFTKVHTPIKVAARSGGEGDAAEKPGLVYSLSNYRKTEATPQREKVIFDNTKDVVNEMMASETKSADEMVRRISHDHIQKKIKQLEIAQTVANNQIQQTEKALKVSRHTNNKSSYPNYNQEVELLQTLQTLIERRRACYLEYGRLSNASDLFYIFPRATIRFTKIAVEVHRHLDVAPNHHAYLFALVRYNEQVVSSQAIFINPVISQGVGSVEFCDIMEIEDVSPDFSMSIEIYGLTLVRKDSKYDTNRFNIKRMVSSPQPERPNPNEVFGRIGQVVIDREDLTKKVLELSSYETPLAGHCRINFQPKISDIDDNKWSGFVSIYRVVDGKGAWELCYSNINNNRLNFWRYPEDADTK
uniref:Anillin homology domain-containing protein n=1 Tax=Panagrolaimus sp. ES5 TaxID=591445 RepID=A0AC34G3J4_9BILA